MKCISCKEEMDQSESHNGLPLYKGKVCGFCNLEVIKHRIETMEKK